MARQQPWRTGVLQTFCVHAMTLQKLSLALHKYIFLVCRFLIFDFFILMGCQASSEYQLDISHFAPSSSETSVCSVEPGSAEDVGKIVRYLDLTLQHLPTCIFLVTYLGIKRNALCGERWRTCRESGIFLDSRRTDRDDTLQRDKG